MLGTTFFSTAWQSRFILLSYRRHFFKTKMPPVRFVDIGVNLTDPMFRGNYRGKQAHPDDLSAVLERSRAAGMVKMMVTGGCLADAREALDMAKANDMLYSTVGCHPTRCKEFDEKEGGPEGYLSALRGLIEEGKEKVVAVGECGLDYDRLEFCPKDIQLKYFEKQFDLAESTQLPMFLHLRSAAQDFIEIMKRHRHRIKGGVVHSFDGSIEEANELIALDLFIGINGCSLKTEENLKVVAQIPPERLMIETDAPWCDIRPTHASDKHVVTREKNSKKKEKWEVGCVIKGRNEPANIRQVMEVVAGVQQRPIEDLADVIYKNTMHMFFPEHPLDS
eukprot:comp19963_c0_seq1/m.24328 comp19963_c0_seq1/g.24328  ORF comp19963_c0_seq1/g.24328 comp19963_c0_seq1/m.24328 type:complete len:335 (-) comp19963_c0_seq1:133-1137(-)